jgi:HEAT repeat protein
VPNGRPFGTLTVPVINDGDPEAPETVTATISSPSNPNVNIATASATANIAEDEVVPPLLNASLSMLTEGDEAGPQSLIYTVFLIR